MYSHAMLIPLMEPAMRCMTSLKATATGLEIITPAKTLSVDAGKEFRCCVAVEVREPESVGSNVPLWAEPEEVGERCYGIA